MTILGTLAIAIAVPLYLVAIHAHLEASPLASSTRKSPANSSSPAGFLAQLAFWIALAAALVSGIAEDRMTWIASSRTAQAFSVLLGLTATAVITHRSLPSWHRPIDSLPWSLRPLAPWAAFILPPILLVSTLFLIQPGLAEVLPASWPRAALGTVASVSLLANAFALVTSASRLGRANAADAATLS